MPPPPPNIFAGLKLPNLLPPPPPPPFIPPPPPPPPPTPPPTTPATTTSPSTVASLVQTGFPTLLPESATAPIIAELIDERGINSEISEKTIQIGSNGAIDGVIEAGNKPKKKKKKGVLKPPTMPGIAVDELVELVDEPEDINFVIQHPPPDPPMLPSISEAENINLSIQHPPNINAAIQKPPPDPPMLPSASEAEQTFSISDSAAAVQNGQATIPAQREETGNRHGNWNIRPSGYKSEGTEATARDGEAVTKSNTTTFNVIERKNQVIPPSINNGNEFNNNNAEEHLGVSRSHQRPFPPAASSMTKANTTLISTLSTSQCNIQPDFLPCVSTEKAAQNALNKEVRKNIRDIIELQNTVDDD
uniref:WH2 domain-containing protein n=1 Tax=Panagrolaimus davidi TaxID=227884 RepID=A0A914PJE3_9BILA